MKTERGRRERRRDIKEKNEARLTAKRGMKEVRRRQERRGDLMEKKEA